MVLFREQALEILDAARFGEGGDRKPEEFCQLEFEMFIELLCVRHMKVEEGGLSDSEDGYAMRLGGQWKSKKTY